MNSRVKTQLVLFGVILGLVIVAITGATYQTFVVVWELKRMRLTSESMEADYRRIATELPTGITELNTTLMRFVVTGDQADWQHFEGRQGKFLVWLEEQKLRSARVKVVALQPFALTMDINGLLNQISGAHQVYMQAASQVRLLRDDTANRARLLDVVTEAQEESGKLFRLATVAGGHGDAIRLFNASAQWMPEVQHRYVIIASLLGAVGVGGWLMVVIYRRQIAPLHEELLETRAVMEKKDRLAQFGELAAGLAHEIRNPLAAINARLFTLERAVDEGTPEHEDAMVIRSEIVRLDRIVQDFFRLARPAEPVLEVISIEKIYKGVCDLLQSSLEKQSIRLTIDGMTPSHITADSHQLKQVLINLIKNAAESMPAEGGKVTLRARESRERLQDANRDVIVLDVEDTGPGIPQGIQERLFEPFNSTKSGGTGLGLAISARIVEKHGGALRFTTRAGKGTTFSIILPKAQKAA